MGGDIVNLADFGFIFFIGLGVTLVSLSLLEKYGIEINTSIVKGVLAVILIAGVAYSVVTDGFIPHLIMGGNYMSISLMTAIAVGIPVVLGASAFIPKSLFEKNDEKKNIEQIFENMKLGIPPQHEEEEYKYPKFKQKYPIKDGNKYIGTNYHFSVPLGFPATKITESDSVRTCISDDLNKPVEIEFDFINKKNGKVKFLQVKVFDEELPSLVPYSEVPVKKVG